MLPFRDSKFVIAFGFGIMLLLMLALMVIGLFRMSNIYQRMENIADVQGAKTQIIYAMRDIVRHRSLSLYTMLLMKDPFDIDDEYMDFNRQAAQFIELRDRLESMELTDEERDLLAQAKAIIRITAPLQESVAEEIMDGDAGQVNYKWIAKDYVLEKRILHLFDQMVRIERDATHQAVNYASHAYRNALFTMLVVGLAILGFGVLTTRLVLRRTGAIERALFEEKELAEVTLHSISDAVMTTDELGRVVYLNPVAEQLTGWSQEQAEGQPLEGVYRTISEQTRQPVIQPATLGQIDGRVTGLAHNLLLIGKHGMEYAIQDTTSPIRDSRGRVIGAAIVFRDVTQERHLQRELSWQARHDALTGLANRLEFEHQLALAIEHAHGQSQQHALLYLDLDQFKLVNDTCGHVAGDDLLKQLAGVLETRVRKSDVLARLGGDEFGILLRSCPPERAQMVAETIHDAVQGFRFAWEGKVFRVGVCIGVVVIDEESEEISSLLAAADAACYIAKDRGRNRIWIHEPGDSETVRREGEMQWVRRLNEALEQDRFTLYHQRAERLGGSGEGDIRYSELLLRLIDPHDQIISPMSFIPAAERYGVMTEIDRWVIRYTLRLLEERELVRAPTDLFAINVSAQSMCDDKFFDFVAHEMARSGTSARHLCFEVTETAAMANLGHARRFVSELRAMGCRFALDDFGSGMSGFAYLKNLPVDFVKIDGSFVKDILNDDVDAAMVEAINRIAQVMGISTIAEFVETEAIRERLRALGVNYVQGYAVHRPEPL
ncbi:MAG TPA: EAL domain-containing protein [Gammaproteobacteria bacterium]|nr:EAL domain-containing protein [Gammaproteobacteria bacterium]